MRYEFPQNRLFVPVSREGTDQFIIQFSVNTVFNRYGSQPFKNPCFSTSRIAAKERDRWLILFFSSAVNSAYVREKPSGIKIGSYPKPFVPRGSSPSKPEQIPSVNFSTPLETSANTDRNCARLLRGETPRISSKSLILFDSSVAPAPE